MEELCGWPRCSCKARTICKHKSGKQEVSPDNDSKALPKHKVEKKRTPIKRKSTFDAALLETDMKFYLEKVWAMRPHKCQCGCNQPIPSPLIFNFHHLLEKSTYPEFRHEEWNIYLVTTDCHNAYHSNSSNRPVLEEAKQSLIRQLETNGYSFSKYKINKKDVPKNRSVIKRQ